MSRNVSAVSCSFEIPISLSPQWEQTTTQGAVRNEVIQSAITFL